MYAAAGGASLASRRAGRKNRAHHLNENINQQLNKRFQHLQHFHAPACAEGYSYGDGESFFPPSRLASLADIHQRQSADLSVLEGKSTSTWLYRTGLEKKNVLSPCSEEGTPSSAGHILRPASTPLDGSKKYRRRSKLPGSWLDEDNIRGGLHRQYDAAANMLLYIGLCLVALGLVIAFVGTGEKGFKTMELRFIGPTMIGFGLFCCTLRIIFCFCPTKYMRRKCCLKSGERALLSDEAQLNALEYYKFLPYKGRTDDFIMYERHTRRNDKQRNRNKRVCIDDDNKIMMGDSASNLSTLRELSPLREEDMIDFNKIGSLEAFPSLDSSLEYLNETDKAMPSCSGSHDILQHLSSEERLCRLKSTLTFQDSKDRLDVIGTTLTHSSYEDFDLRDDAFPFQAHSQTDASNRDELLLNAASLKE